MLAVSETWITNNNDSFIIIPGYNRVLNNRKTGRGGGVALFILNTLIYSVRNDCNLNIDGKIESLFVDIENNKSMQKKTVGVVYKAPDYDLPLFTSSFECLLKKLV